MLPFYMYEQKEETPRVPGRCFVALLVNEVCQKAQIVFGLPLLISGQCFAILALLHLLWMLEYTPDVLLSLRARPQSAPQHISQHGSAQ